MLLLCRDSQLELQHEISTAREGFDAIEVPLVFLNTKYNRTYKE